MKKILASILVLSMLLMLAACGTTPPTKEPSSGETTGEASGSTTGKTTVNFWHSMGAANGDRIQAMVERFNASQDEVEVIATFQGNYEEGNAKLQTAIPAGTAPDIVQLERAYVEPYATAQRLADLNPFLKENGLSGDSFVEGLMGYSYYNDDGKMYSIPFSRSTPIFYYNKDAFTAAGLDPEKPPVTWEDVREYAEKLTIKEGDTTTQYGITWPIATWYFKANVAQLGGRTINEDKTAIGFYENGTGLEVFKMWLDLRDSGFFKVVPVKDGPNMARQAFINGECAMFQESTSIIGTLKENTEGSFELGAAFLPHGGEPAMPTGGANISMLESSQNKDAAWKFINWIMEDPEGGLEFVLQSGYLPFTKSMVESQAIQDLWAKEQMYKVAYDQLDYAVDTEQHLYWAELKSEMLNMEQAVMNDNEDPETALKTLYDKSINILAQ